MGEHLFNCGHWCHTHTTCLVHRERSLIEVQLGKWRSLGIVYKHSVERHDLARDIRRWRERVTLMTKRQFCCFDCRYILMMVQLLVLVLGHYQRDIRRQITAKSAISQKLAMPAEGLSLMIQSTEQMEKLGSSSWMMSLDKWRTIFFKKHTKWCLTAAHY